MTWQTIQHNIESIVVAFAAGLSVFIIKMFLTDKRRLTVVEQKLKDHVDTTEKILTQVHEEQRLLHERLTECNLSVSTQIASLASTVEAMDKKIDKIPTGLTTMPPGK